MNLTSNHIGGQPPLADGAYDVIIVGARVAGAATALLTARAGLRTIVIDRGAPDTDPLSTHALMRAGVLQLARWGLLDRVIAAGTPSVNSTEFRYGGPPLRIDIKPAHGVDRLYAPRRTVLDPIVRDAAVEAGAAVHHHTAIAQLLRRDNRVVGVRASTRDGRLVDLRAPLVIGADGMRSTVAALVDAPFTKLAPHAAAVTYAYWPDLELDRFQWNFLRHACSGLIPTNGGQTCVFVSAPGAAGRGDHTTIIDAVAAASPEMGDRLRAVGQPTAARSFPGHHGFVRRSHGPGWALVGDAGCFKDPIGAHGITDALRDAELLARAVIAGGTPDDLAGFEATRDALGADLFDVVDRIAGHEWDADSIAELLKRQSIAMGPEVELLAALDARKGAAA
jgi:2-polyprenyl-6-methoxyphenol hydroxylase-like FAD-dependent oxidoreductase